MVWFRTNKIELIIFANIISKLSHWLPQWLLRKEFAGSVGAAGDASSIPGSGRSPGGGHGNPLQCSCLRIPMCRAAWQATVHSIAKSWTQLKWLSMRAHGKIFLKPMIPVFLEWHYFLLRREKWREDLLVTIKNSTWDI